MSKLFLSTFLIFCLFSFSIYGNQEKPIVQVAILLDTSNSMDGLINQTKGQLWKIVSDLAQGKYKEQAVDIEVALYEYGNNSINITNGYIRKVSDFTTNLDLISDKLFSLRTNGGDEYCGQAIQDATKNLNWKDGEKTLKIIYIAGNEPFTQGKINYVESVKEATKKGIIVNTIFCGNHQEGINTNWQNGAIIGNGTYLNIDQDRREVAINAPQDKLILELGVKLNKTYIPYGKKGKSSLEMQKKQDKNAATISSSTMVQRAVFKSKAQYKASSWDLIDALNNKEVTLEKLNKDELPDNMKSMSIAEQKSYVEKMSKERSSIKKEIAELEKKRAEYIKKEEKKLNLDEEKTIKREINKSLRKNKAIQEKDFKF